MVNRYIGIRLIFSSEVRFNQSAFRCAALYQKCLIKMSVPAHRASKLIKEKDTTAWSLNKANSLDRGCDATIL